MGVISPSESESESPAKGVRNYRCHLKTDSQEGQQAEGLPQTCLAEMGQDHRPTCTGVFDRDQTNRHQGNHPWAEC